ncbi:major facilitator transporter, putative [Babesia ovata]|uniref:Major facilitator transporter, putative n=1 Tax=Babesia ovata TaxID=189622 RepID=A0A2H6K948_9APIC|nr:major facilitator transporter, putative [Babesia ovata]GBE59526.1 major facilitator transporter, putative [Babesia ovata]
MMALKYSRRVEHRTTVYRFSIGRLMYSMFSLATDRRIMGIRHLRISSKNVILIPLTLKLTEMNRPGVPTPSTFESLSSLGGAAEGPSVKTAATAAKMTLKSFVYSVRLDGGIVKLKNIL